MTASTPTSRLPWTRAVLIIAALGASVAVGSAIINGRPEEKPENPAAAQRAPSMADIIKQLEDRLKQDPESVEGWRLLGLSYAGEGRYADAVRAYERVTELEPGNAEYWSSLGEAILLADKGSTLPPKAVAAFKQALTIDAKEPRARFFLGMVKVDQGDAKGAIADWIRLLKDNPPDAPWAASVRQKIEDVAAANGIDVAGELAALPAPSGPTQAQIQAAAEMTPAQQREMARQMVESLATRLRANPKDPQGWLQLMRARMVLGDPAGAKQALSDARSAYAGDASQLAIFSEAAQSLGLTER
jgi:cytochrome c-type biogenesis protein CcmH